MSAVHSRGETSGSSRRRPAPPDAPAAAASRWLFLSKDRFFLIGKTPLIVGVGAYLAGASFRREVWLAMGLASLLWFCLYALNESADALLEEHARVRRRHHLLLMAAALALSGAAAALTPWLAVLFGLMLATQIAYSMPPLRWKRHWELVILISGLANPVLRLQSGAVFGTHAVPALAYATLLLLHLGGALRTRLLRRERDQSLGYRVAPGWMHYAGLGATLVGLAAGGAMCLQGLLPRPLLAGEIVAVPFALYAWSGRARDVTTLRRAWVLPAALLPVVLLLLYR